MSKDGLKAKSMVRDGMKIDIDVPIPMDDGLVLRADVYRPVEDGRYPALISYGPYAKGLAFQEAYKPQWDRMASEHPDVLAGSTNKYQTWEALDPEKWVPDGYVCVRVDSRGAGPVAGRIGCVVAQGDSRLLSLHRVGGGPAVEQWAGRARRHLLLRHEPIPGGGP